ncbi:OLC1v1013819C1 [Oldenlandia corymbosa var. corymbosa]|uniref:OLC1v1013819C1 n=1 Tax=Oldenlandia corymbosa var. corymbosa TaxID=529605 RepID=A0AAV1DZL6_OLDCO|nr:OLC1v1013819C1 [Oldenlandia corymbosa var. corymbosa]
MICLSIDYLSVPQHIEISQRFGAEKRIIPRGHFNKQSFRVGLKPLVLNSGRTRLMATVVMSSREKEAIMLTSGASGRINALLSLRLWRSLFMVMNAFVLLLFLPFRRRRVASQASVSGAGNQGGGAGGSANGKDEKSVEKKGVAVVRVPASMVPARKSAAAAAAVVDKEVAARRALAIKRVLEDEDKNSVREYMLFDTQRGVTLFTQSWTPATVKVRGVVVLLHGLNEHSGRYNDFAKQLNANGYKVYGMDWIGHGGSDGLHAYVHSLDDAVCDMKLFIKKVATENPGLQCFCFGHSTGGAIILKAALDPEVEARIAGVVLTSPAVGVQPSHPIFAVLAPVFAFLLPRYQFSAANKRGSVVSRDPEALIAKYSDPLVFTGSIRIRTGYEILRITTYLQQNLKKLKVPFLVLHGTSDSVTDPEASQKLYIEAASSDKSIRLLDGLLHDLLFEPERQEIVEDIIQWLNQRL